jgi:hypothetical protein
MNGSPMAIATVVNGLGICVRSQLRMRHARCASIWNGTIGLPVAFASQRHPGCTLCAGPRGPSTAKPVDRPASMTRFIWTSARTPPRDDDPRAVPYPKRVMIRAIHSPS